MFYMNGNQNRRAKKRSRRISQEPQKILNLFNTGIFVNLTDLEKTVKRELSIFAQKEVKKVLKRLI